VISNNSAAGAGGILFNGPGTLTLANTVISGNSIKNWGAGIYSSGANPGTVILTDCTLSNNITTGGAFVGNMSQGGAIFSRGALTLTGCTLANNFAYNEGGAIVN
jgi:hypothetical protein